MAKAELELCYLSESPALRDTFDVVLCMSARALEKARRGL